MTFIYVKDRYPLITLTGQDTWGHAYSQALIKNDQTVSDYMKFEFLWQANSIKADSGVRGWLDP